MSIRSKLKTRVMGIIGLLIASIATAYASDNLVEKMFWSKLYPQGGKTFYCKQDFSRKSARLAIDLIYNSSHIESFVGCSNRITCKSNKEYIAITSDYHNMVPAMKKVYLQRRDSSFGELATISETDFSEYNCQYKSSFQTVDPSDEVKGDIARTMFYMHQEYKLPFVGHLEMYQRWHKLDPVDAIEKRRNDLIEKLQGKRNPFIDNPQLAGNLQP